MIGSSCAKILRALNLQPPTSGLRPLLFYADSIMAAVEVNMAQSGSDIFHLELMLLCGGLCGFTTVTTKLGPSSRPSSSSH